MCSAAALAPSLADSFLSCDFFICAFLLAFPYHSLSAMCVGLEADRLVWLGSGEELSRPGRYTSQVAGCGAFGFPLFWLSNCPSVFYLSGPHFCFYFFWGGGEQSQRQVLHTLYMERVQLRADCPTCGNDQPVLCYPSLMYTSPILMMELMCTPVLFKKQTSGVVASSFVCSAVRLGW